MAESLDEFFSDDVLIGSNIRDEAAFIHEYLNGQNGSIPAQIVAKRIVQSLRTRNAPLENAQYNISDIIENIIVRAAEQLPQTHSALVTLLGALKQQDETNDIEPYIAFSLNERLLRYGDPDQSLNMLNEFRNDWTSLNKFAALIYEARLQDLSSFGIATLWMALRQREWRVNWKDTNTSDSIIALEGHAPAAVQWILVCGQRLHDECSEAREKWAVWETNLDWIVGQPQLDEAIKLNCQEALLEMRRIAS